MLLNKFKDIDDYIEFLNNNTAEINSLCADILINVTRFFRDPELFKTLKKNVFPKLFRNRKSVDPIRIWISACSSGEEAYSMAIALVEYLGTRLAKYNIQIFSTDLNEAGIEKARSGIYSENIREDVSEARLKKFFIRRDSKYQINKNIRNLCVFAKQNLIEDPPFSKIDLITCRNVLIYLGTVLQNKIIPIFHYALKNKGYLVLGTSETIGTWKKLFELTDRKNRIYIKKQTQQGNIKHNDIEEMLVPEFELDKSVKAVQSPLADQFNLETDPKVKKKYYFSYIIFDRNMEVLQFKGNLASYFDIPQDNETLHLLKICRKELAVQIKPLIQKLFKNGRSIRKNNVKFFYQNEERKVNIVLKPVALGDKSSKKYLVIFEDRIGSDALNPVMTGTKSADLKVRFDMDRMKRELIQSKTDLQDSVEMRQTADEELRAANEEIQTSNEELQSTNEELETLKEELQSTNEELTTVNEELLNRNLNLSKVNSDLNNILNNVRFSILMVDNELRIKRFTKDLKKIFHIIPSDIGRKITDIKSRFNLGNLRTMIKDVLDRSESTIIELKGVRNSVYSMRISPYKTVENRIDGVLITFVNVSELKESIMREQNLLKEKVSLANSLYKQKATYALDLKKLNTNLEKQLAEKVIAESSLRRLSKNMNDAQEIERLKLSRELHDNVNQLLSMAKLKINNLEEAVKKNSKSTLNLKSVTDAKANIVYAIEEVRRLSKVLRPSALDDFGLETALRSIIEDFRMRSGVRVNFQIENLRKGLSEDIELTLYRIVQESLHNIEKHSRAENVRINLTGKGNNIQLVITDNGLGFSQRKFSISKLKQFGLLGIRERSDSVGGKFNLKSEVGLGTRIEVTLPVLLKNKNGKDK